MEVKNLIYCQFLKGIYLGVLKNLYYQLNFPAAYLYSNFGCVSCFARKNLEFCGISTVVFLLNNSGGVFLLSASRSANFFPAVQTIFKFGNLSKTN